MLQLPAFVSSKIILTLIGLLVVAQPIQMPPQNKNLEVAEMKKELEGTLIFDNGGGITVQLPGFAHYYDDPEEAARDVIEYIKDGNTNGWEGQEEEAAELDPTYDQIKNGGYRVYSLVDIIEEAKSEDSTGWNNIDSFCVELAQLLK